ncbi:hypothetical protein DER30_0941 [Streptomyces sp. HB202]|nr:hypothetical protein DER30_0941 [Streptomyces sp. HB202]
MSASADGSTVCARNSASLISMKPSSDERSPA